jgi:cytochrome c oxidase cbb3-type subunit IV
MDYTFWGSISTVVTFVTFIGIVAWAWSSRRRVAFEAAAQEPFALPDEAANRGIGQTRGRQ